MKRTVLVVAEIAALVAGIAALVATAAVAAPWQVFDGGAGAVSRGDDSPLPTPTAEHHVYVPSLLRHSAVGFLPGPDTPAPWQGFEGGTGAMSRGDDSPLPTPTPTAEHHAYVPSVLRHSMAGFLPGPDTPTPTATHTPTPTSTPTGTPTPTATPTDTPTPLPVRVLANHTHYVDGEGSLHVVGEVENGTVDPVYRVGITVLLLSSDGQVAGTGHGVAPLQHLGAGKRTCFDVALAEPADWSSYEFEAPGYSPGEPPPTLSVVSDSGTYVPGARWYLLGGEVRNDHGTRVKDVTVVGTLYDGAGNAIRCEGTYVLSIGLEPDETSLFELAFTGRDHGDVASYRVQVDGEPE